ncbi:hypothetical protein JNUCC1_03172 [Lentibacillus sp. JNUCC-1]|uniref:hypothetical protein n=1 Tax=Lentibacillus sp. JNUCC-1 TaxID=2654513 RepID=UPI0012E88E17|nr:hypothetical protein [Lentibacillus sp. JNUCC-1]MUV39296.1 hypothetical protein [Lentibacillus sp. JNUCC-1]
MDKHSLNDFLFDSFYNGAPRRELRLSEEEIHYIRKRFPKIKCTPIQDAIHSDKQWYTISLGERTSFPIKRKKPG